MKRISFIIVLIYLFGCEKDISSDFADDVGNWFAISGMISGGATPSIHVSETVNLLDLDSVKQVEDANVAGVIGGQPVQFTHDAAGRYVCSELIVEPGDSIRINCSGRELPDASVELGIPELPQLSDFTWYIDEEYVLHLEALLKDPPGQHDYYSLRASGIKEYVKTIYEEDSVHEISYLGEGYYHGYNFPDSLAEYSLNYRGSLRDQSERMITTGQIIYFSDQQFDGAEKQLNLEYALVYAWNDSIPEITVHIAKNDVHLFNYFESFIHYNPDPDIPVMQPIRVYTNVENGFGLLTAESKITELIDLNDVYSDPDFLSYRDSVMFK